MNPKSSVRYDPVGGAPASKTKKKRDLLNHGWFWEAVSMAASFACTVAVVAILARMQNRQLREWTFFISVNATIAIFITAAKSTAILSVAACLGQFKWLHFNSDRRLLRELDLFEEACRGPLGSILLLFRVRQHLGIASIGAIATILALGVDTFAQQVVSFEPRDVHSTEGGAAFGLSHAYDGGTKLVGAVGLGNGFAGSTMSSTADAAMEGAVYRGIFNISSRPVFNCASRCLWNESYVSLGFQTKCENVTAATLKTIKGGYYEGFNMTTPGGISLNATNSPTSYQTATNVVTKDLTETIDLGDGIEPQGAMVPPDFIRIAILRDPDPTQNFTINVSSLEVTECNLGFAAYNYTRIDASGNNFLPERVDTIDLEPGLVVAYDFTDRPFILFNQTGLPEMKVMAADLGGLIQLFTSSRFEGEVFDGEDIPQVPVGIGLALQKGNVSEAFENMAASMTDQLRSNYNVTAHGLTVESVVFVSVQWVWLLLPFLVQVAAAVFLGLTIVSSRGRHFQLWKSSTVAMLYHEVVPEGATQGTLRTDIQSLEQLDLLSKRTKAKLE